MPRHSLLALALLLSACSHEPTSPVVGGPPASPDAVAPSPSTDEIAYAPIDLPMPPPPVAYTPAPQLHPCTRGPHRCLTPRLRGKRLLRR